MIRLLVFTALYPNAEQPNFGVFVENRLRNVLATGKVEATVVAPVPWFPFRSRRFGRYAAFARVPKQEERHGITIYHPRFLLIPKIALTISPWLMYLSLRRFVRQLIRSQGGVDMIDAHYFYPDGMAGVLLARELKLPVTVTGRGTDLNLVPKFRLARRQIAWAAQKASAVITVCEALKEPLLEMGVPDGHVTVLRNGVELDLFSPQDREASRARYGLKRPTLVSVGALVERKGHDIIVRALPSLPGIDLLIAGEGEERARLEQLIGDLDLKDRVTLLGQVPHGELPALYTAADIMVLASDREGWANVLLEAMACGTPVVATNIWGTGEVVRAPEAGLLVDERTPEALSDAIGTLLTDPPERAATRAYAEGFSWDATTNGQLAIFSRLTAGSDPA